MKKLWWRMPIFIVIWILFVALKVVVILTGLIAVLFLFAYRDVTYDSLPWWTRPWANPEDWYGGPMTYEKTSLPKWWVDKHGESEWSFYRYHAIRNPANGLRSFEWLDLDIDPAKVKYVTPFLLATYEPWHMRKMNDGVEKIIFKKCKYWCWQGYFKAGYKYVKLWKDLQPHWWTDWQWWIFKGPKSGPRHFVAKFGWRVQPSDATFEIDPLDIRIADAGFATKLLPYRKG